MEKSELETMLSEIQERHQELVFEEKRLEGDFRTTQSLIENWKTNTEEEKGDQAVDAQANPPTS